MRDKSPWFVIGVFFGALVICHFLALAECGFDADCAFSVEAGR